MVVASNGLAQSINGKWKGEMQGPNGAMEMMYNFKVNADSLSGSIENPMGELPISNGKVKGNKFSYDLSFNDMTFTNQGTFMGDSISIKFQGMQGDTMEIILKRVPDSK
jgi:hypothetical protein